MAFFICSCGSGFTFLLPVSAFTTLSTQRFHNPITYNTLYASAALDIAMIKHNKSSAIFEKRLSQSCICSRNQLDLEFKKKTLLISDFILCSVFLKIQV